MYQSSGCYASQRQLFYNIIDNSLKYGEKVKKIRAYYELVGEDQLKLVYEDDGVGIPMAEKERKFHRRLREEHRLRVVLDQLHLIKTTRVGFF